MSVKHSVLQFLSDFTIYYSSCAPFYLSDVEVGTGESEFDNAS